MPPHIFKLPLNIRLFGFWLLCFAICTQSFANEHMDPVSIFSEELQSNSDGIIPELEPLDLSHDQLDGLNIWLSEAIDLNIFNLGLDIKSKRSAKLETEDYVKKLNEEFSLKLFGHQLAGISLLMDHQETLLADDMGLGKTVQAIYACMFDKNIKNVVVMVPPSLTEQWVRKINEWVGKLSPDFKASVFNRELSKTGSYFAEHLQVSGSLQKNANEANGLNDYTEDIVAGAVNFYFISANWLSTGIDRVEKAQDILKLFLNIASIDALIVDEVHKYSTGTAIKKVLGNVFGLSGKLPDSAGRFESLRKKIDNMKVILLSGTPIRNSVAKELSYLGELLQVKDAPLLRSKKRKRISLSGDPFKIENEQEVRDAILLKIVRRTKLGLIADQATRLHLPPISYEDVSVNMDVISHNKYETLRKATRLFAQDRERSLSLNLTQILRQIAVSYDFVKQETKNKLGNKVDTQWTGKQLNQILKEIGSGFGIDIDLEGNIHYECPVCLSEQVTNSKAEGTSPTKQIIDSAPDNLLYLPCGHYHCRDCTAKLRQSITPRCSICKTAIPSQKTLLSAREYKELLNQRLTIPEDKSAGHIPPKFEQVLAYLQETDEDKVLLFSEFKRPIHALKQFLEENGIAAMLVDNNLGDPKQQIALFERDSSKKICLLTFGYAEGHNISSANHVIFLTPPLSAHVYSQAVDRVYRLGQKKPVSIINLIAENTIDSIVYDRLRQNIKTIEDFYSLEVEVTDQTFEEANQQVRTSVGELVR
ncbi:MAG: SNF2-related protein [Oligoflexales bacterium]